MASVGGSSSRQRATTDAPTFINPLTGILANLFGVPVGLSSKTGGIVIGAPGTRTEATGAITPIPSFGTLGDPFRSATSGNLQGRISPGSDISLQESFDLFRKDRTDSEVLGGTGAPFSGRAFFPSDFLSIRDQLLATAGIGLDPGFGAETAGGARSTFANTILPGVTELAETGFRTSASDLISNELLPQLREENILIGGSGFESDFQANALRTALSAQVGLDEAAAGRRIGGLSALSGLELGFGADLATFEAIERERELAGRPGRNILDLLLKAAGLPAGFTTGQTSTARTSSFDIGIGGGGGGGGGGSTTSIG